MSFFRLMLRNRGAMIGSIGVLLFFVTAVFAPLLAPYAPDQMNLINRFQRPSSAHPFGTDQFGRDILSRVIWGSRISLIVGLSALGLAAVVGTILGAVAGFYSKWLDEIIMRTVDVLLSFPDIFLAIAVTTIMRPGLNSTIIAIGVYNLPQVIRVARGSVLSVRKSLYVESAEAIGLNRHTILFKHILPNAVAPILVLTTVRLAASIMTAAGLSFLGVGIQPPTPEWGSMISEARSYIVTAPHLSLIPGFAILLTVLSLNLVGDAMNDILNPRIRGRRASLNV